MSLPRGQSVLEHGDEVDTRRRGHGAALLVQDAAQRRVVERGIELHRGAQVAGRVQVDLFGAAVLAEGGVAGVVRAALLALHRITSFSGGGGSGSGAGSGTGPRIGAGSSPAPHS